MGIFSSKLNYALRALLDLAAQPPGRAAQSREIALRQRIPESYLNQLLVTLRRAGLVRSIRGATGGYTLGRDASLVTVADVVEALHGDDLLQPPPPSAADLPTASVVKGLQSRVHRLVRDELARTSLASLTVEVNRLDEASSLMLGI